MKPYIDFNTQKTKEATNDANKIKQDIKTYMR